MANADDFWIYIYEATFILRVKDIDQEVKFPNWLEENFGEGDKEKFLKLIEDIRTFDFDKMRDISHRLNILRQNYRGNWRKIDKLEEEYDQIYEQYQELSTRQFRLTGKDKYLIMSLAAMDTDDPLYQGSMSTYRFLTASTVIRDKKEYPITDDLILEVFGQNPDYYRESLFFDQDVQLLDLMRIFGGMFETHFNKIYPIKHKDSLRKRKGKIEELEKCQQTQHGVLRGLVHKIGYTGYRGKHDDFLMMIINSGYLEIQFQERNPTSGIFTTMLGYDNSIEKMYGNANGIFFILSLKALEDFDYWAGRHGMGARKKTDFYKGICHACGDDGLEKYSAAERAYMAMVGDKHEKFYELIFSGDLSIRRYLEAIYVPNKFIRKKLTESEIVPEHIKVMITSEIPKDMVFRKGCEGDKPRKMPKKSMDKLVKLVQKRENMDTIPKINYQSINMKRKVKILYDPLKSEGGMDFPTPE